MEQRNADCSFCCKSYRDVGPLVAGPGEVYICGQCNELCQSIISQEKRRRNRSAAEASPLLTAEAIRGRLDQFVTGQEEAKGALVQAALRPREVSGLGPHRLVLVIGSTRSSKVFLARALAHAMEAPFAEGDSHALVRSGNEPAEPLVYRLLLASDFDVTMAERGIVYVDGIDHRTAQERLLQLWKRAASDTSGNLLQIDLDRILFICGGKFTGLDEVVAQLGRHPEQPVTGEILAAFGLAPDLIQRLQAIVRVAPLDEEAVARIVPFVDFDLMARGDGEQSAADQPGE